MDGKNHGQSKTCNFCGSDMNTIILPCGHVCCIACVCKKSLHALRSLNSILEVDINHYNGKASGFGCPQQCSESDVFWSPEYIFDIIRESDIFTSEDKQFVEENMNLGETFFSGISTRFFKCTRCKKTKSDIKENLIVCRDCLSEIFKYQFNKDIDEFRYTIDWQNKIENIDGLFKLAEKNNWFFTACSDQNNSYKYYEDPSNNCIQVKILEPGQGKYSILVIAFLMDGKETEGYLPIADNSMIELALRAHFE